MEESKGGESSRPALTDDIPTQPTPASGVVNGDQDMQIPEFSLCAALVGHTGDVRSLAVGAGHLYSGARDKVVMAWSLDEDGHIAGTHTAPAAQITLSDWVNALTVAAPAGSDGDGNDDELVVAGCKDGGIYVVAWSGGPGEAIGVKGSELVVKTTLLGHTAPISSLSWNGAEGLLLSGSWDETARAWDLKTATCKWTLGGHENNVCVLGLGPGCLATGSTGLNVEGHLVGQQIRMWEGSPPKECRSLTDHTAGIRDLCLVDIDASSSASSPSAPRPAHCFCSASNDATVRAWTHDGDCRAVFTIPDESFVFSVSHLGGGLIASGDDAGNLCAAHVPNSGGGGGGGGGSTKRTAKVVYKHPKTVWSVAGLRRVAAPSWTATTPSSPAADPATAAAAVVADVATGSADYAVRVFTPDSGRALQGDRLQEAEEVLGEGGDVCTSPPGPPGGRLGGRGAGDRLPSVAEMGVMVGTQDGQLSAFADEVTGAAQVFRWTEAVGGGEAKWENLGPLQPPARKVEFEGCLYDKVIPVEVESASRGFLMFQLGVNRGDDPKSVASAFCQKHSLGPEYMPQIEQFMLLAWL